MEKELCAGIPLGPVVDYYLSVDVSGAQGWLAKAQAQVCEELPIPASDKLGDVLIATSTATPPCSLRKR